MRAIFVNHCHPDEPHICAVRLREFARVMAGRGHQIILLTETLSDDDPGITSEVLAARLASHEWSQPFSLDIAPFGHRMLSQARRGKLLKAVRRALLSIYYLRYGGVHRDWQEGALRCLPVLAKNFRPDVVWATFGNATSWQIARDISRTCGCPWVADLKDHWQSFIPAVLRRHLASRYGNAAAFTAFSDDHVATIGEWFRRPASVVYSGIDPALYPASVSPTQTITLTGAVYERADLMVLMEGIEAAVTEMEATDRQTVRFCYAGHDADVVREQVAGLEKLITVDIREQQPLGAWLEVLSGAAINCYVKSSRTFHHKIFDLAGAGRPVLTVPRETDEAYRIAALAGVTLAGAETAEEIAALVKASLLSDDPGLPVDRAALSWERRAETLDEILQSVVGNG
tara:strand:+ start:197 stop:1399 length:1203 start_codon:yes stop_codon:yes gene_type:complete